MDEFVYFPRENVSTNDEKPIELPEIPKDVIFPNELNQYLTNQVQLLTYQNNVLKKSLSEKESSLHDITSKLDHVNVKVKDYETLCGKNEFVTSSAVASTKIVELSKKLREKCSEIEVYKTKCSKLEYDLCQVEKKFEPDSPIIKVKETVEPNELQEKIKELQEKLTATRAKLLESKDGNVQLKNELKLANKWLQQETGENFENLNKIHNYGSLNWRGRAQIICDLQQKNNELREKVKSLQDKNSSSVPDTPVTKNDKKLESLTKENTELKATVEDLRKKLDSTRVRIKFHETESSVLKNKISNLMAEKDKNQQLIDSLNTQIDVYRQFKNECNKLKEMAIKKYQDEQVKIQTELDKSLCMNANLTKEMNAKNEELELLRNKIRGSRPQSSYGNRPPNETFQNEEKLVNHLQAEKIRLLELTEVHKNRLDSEREQHEKTQNYLRLERQKAAKLEATLARLELERSTTRSTTYLSGNNLSKQNNLKTPSGTAVNREMQSYKDQLELAEENIKALKTKLELEKHERKVDLRQFGEILKNSTNCKIQQ